MTFGLRTKLLLPLATVALLAGAYLIAFGNTPQLAPGMILLLLLVLLGLMAANIELFVVRPLRGVVEAARDLAQNGLAGVPVDVPPGQMRALSGSIERLRERMREHERDLTEERTRRQALEQSVRELEERFALTVERANDGIWEWNVKSGTVEFSVRWKGMLQLSEARLGRLEDWQALVHPEERAGVVLRLENHVAGLTPHFEEEYRIRQGDGNYRWVHSRGVAIRHANGRAYRVVVMDNDIHRRKELETTLIQAAEGLSAVSGEDFYRTLMRTLSSILGTRDNLVCYCIGDPPTRARTLAYYSKGKFWEDFEYDLAGTSCGSVIDRREIVFCPTGVGDLWPDEKQYHRDSYLGVPMFDSTGKIIGHFACMDGGPMRHDLPHLALFKIFSVRAAAELERTLLRRKLAASDTTGGVGA